MDLTTLTFYHGSAAESVTPTYGLGDDRHDYGRGFYLSDDLALAKEWAVCRPNEQNGWVHAFRVTDPDLTMIDFQELGVLADETQRGRKVAPFQYAFAEVHSKIRS